MKGKKFQETEATSTLVLQRTCQELENFLKRSVSKKQFFPDMNLYRRISGVKCCCSLWGVLVTAFLNVLGQLSETLSTGLKLNAKSTFGCLQLRKYRKE